MNETTAARPLATRLVVVFLASFPLLAPLGCGKSEPVFGYGDADADEIAGKITVLSDFADRPDRFEPLFVQGGAPPVPQRDKFATHAFSLEEEPRVAGDAATISVRIRDGSGQDLGVVTWTAVKSGAEWKLKEYPFP